MNWIWKGRDEVIFETASDRKRNEKRKNIVRFIIAAVILVFVAVFLIFKQYNFDLSSASGSKDIVKETTVHKEADEKVPSASGNKTFMFFCSNDNKTSLRFLILVNVNLDDDVITVHPININDKVLTYRDFSGQKTSSANECFKSGGRAMLYEACQNYLGTAIDKYMGTTDSDFSNIIVNFPNVKVDVESNLKLSFNGDVLYFNEGIQEISDNNLLKYMYYNGRESTEHLLQAQADVAVSAINEFIGESFIENVDIIFERIINLSDSNISTFDVRNNYDSLRYIAQENSPIKYKTELTKDDFIYIVTGEKP
ncbi:MAG: LCP family protein [Clostridia bacterium]|nr:LCP family protein [Clostridia bacterium]